MMKQNDAWMLAVSFVLAAAGFLWPFWPLSVLGIALCAFSGRWFFAILIGLLLDVGYGVPVGRFAFLYVPFTLCALVCGLLRLFAVRYLFERKEQAL